MMERKYFVDLGTNYTVIFGEVPILKEPSCVILKNGYSGKAVDVGGGAAARSGSLHADEHLIYPVSEEGIRHFIGAVAMVKEFMRRGGIKTGDNVTVIAPCCADGQQKQELERVFLTAGYKNVAVAESLSVYRSIAKCGGAVTMVMIGGSRTDLGIVDENGIVLAYSVDIGGKTVDECIMRKVETVYKLRITDETAEKLKNGIGSLYANDRSSMEIVGNDVITGAKKNIRIFASDINPEIEHCYSRIFKVLEGALNVAPTSSIEDIETKGIFLLGGGAKMTGIADYAYGKLCVGATVADVFESFFQ